MTTKQHTYHSATVLSRHPGCTVCASLARQDAHAAIHATTYSGWDERSETFASSRQECLHPKDTPCWPEGKI